MAYTASFNHIGLPMRQKAATRTCYVTEQKQSETVKRYLICVYLK